MGLCEQVLGDVAEAPESARSLLCLMLGIWAQEQVHLPNLVVNCRPCLDLSVALITVGHSPVFATLSSLDWQPSLSGSLLPHWPLSGLPGCVPLTSKWWQAQAQSPDLSPFSLSLPILAQVLQTLSWTTVPLSTLALQFNLYTAARGIF